MSVFMSMIITTAQGYENNSISLMSGISGIALMGTALAHGKVDSQAVAMFGSGVALTGIGHACTSDQVGYTGLVVLLGSTACVLGWLAGIAPGK